VDKLVSTFVKIRDKRSALKQKYEADDAELKNALDALKHELLSTCKAVGAESIKTKFGTAIRSVKSRYWTGDWDSMYTFISEHNAFGLLEKRVHQTNMKQFLDEHPDLKPAGLNIDHEYDITVRRN
jgi:hypothetical protein